MDKHNKPVIQGCIKPTCKKNPKEVKIEYIAPIDIDNEDIKKLLGYFQYYAPNIESKQSPEIPEKQHDEIFYEMTNKMSTLYCQRWNASIKKELKDWHLTRDMVCLYCERAIYKKKKNSNETELKCFLRHIRNSIAHGRVVYLYERKKYYIMFEDINRNKNISARIVCNKTCLEKWKSILSKYSTQIKT